ncbi:MAG TPA: hypothetical protein PL041_04120 [Melioribacteraceae bacterium]|nr:hypothetical protein [Melioribacteraceae bacterium]
MFNLISINELKEGMVFLAPIINRFGQVIITKNTKFEKRHYNILKTWGITTVAAGYEQDKSEIIIDPSIKQLAKEKLERRLLWSPNHEIEFDLYNMALNQSILQIMQEKGL